MMKKYFLLVSKLDPDLEEIIIGSSDNVFRINFSKSVSYFFTTNNFKLIKENLKIDAIFIDISTTKEISINISDQKSLDELLCFIREDNVSIDSILDKIVKNGYSVECLTKSEIEKLKQL